MDRKQSEGIPNVDPQSIAQANEQAVGRARMELERLEAHLLRNRLGAELGDDTADVEAERG